MKRTAFNSAAAKQSTTGTAASANCPSEDKPLHKAWRTAKAAQLKVDVSVVLPQRLIDKLAEAGPRDGDGLEAIEGLRRWRIQAFGREILAAL